MGGRHHFVDLDGLRFHYVEWGDDGAPSLLLLHGVLAAAVGYDTFAEALAENHHVYVLDQRGHGQSAHSDDYSWERWVEDIEAFFAAVGLERADIVGHSMGANNAVRFTARRPDLVRRLVLYEGGYGPTDSPDEGAFWTRVAQLASVDGFATKQTYVDLVSELFPRADLAVASATTEYFTQRPDGRWEFPDSADLTVIGRAQPYELEPEMRRSIRCPVLVAQGECTELYTHAALRGADDFPDAEVVIVPNAGHLAMMMENIDGLVAVIEAFLRRRTD